MKKINISILILAILMVCSSISFGQEKMKPEAKKGNTIQISISPDELNRIMRDNINIDQKLSIDDSKPIMIKISSMPREKWIIRYSGFLSGFLGAVMAFLLALWSFRIQKSSEEKRERKKWEKETFDMYIGLLIEMKRALDRCNGLIKMPEKSFSKLYMRSEGTIFVEFIKRCDRTDIIRKMFAIYHLFDLINWNIEKGLQIEGVTKNGSLSLNDRYGAALGFINQYLWGSSKHYNDLLFYAKDMEIKGAGKVDEYLVEYDLNEIKKINGILIHELH